MPEDMPENMPSKNYTKGRVRLPNQMNFRKNFKRPSIDPSFWKIVLQFFMTHMVAYMGGMMANTIVKKHTLNPEITTLY